MSANDEVVSMLAERSYYTDNGYHNELLPRLKRAGIDGELLRGLKHVAFVLIKPDAVVGGKHADVVRYLLRHRFTPVFGGVVGTPKLVAFEDLYKFNLTKANSRNQLGSWWLNSQTYLLGPSLGLLLAGAGGDGESLHARLNRLKGPSTPHLGERGSLRYDLRATNRAMNLIHVSDDPLSTAREFCIFFRPDALKMTLRRVADLGTDAAMSEADLVRLFRALPSSREDTDFCSVLVALKFRLGSLMAQHVEPSPTLEMLQRVYERMFSSAHGEGDLQARCKELASTCQQEQALLRAIGETLVSGNAVVSRWMEALVRLADPASLDEEYVLDLAAAGERFGLKLTEWERLSLLSSVHYREDYEALFS